MDSGGAASSIAGNADNAGKGAGKAVDEGMAKKDRKSAGRKMRRVPTEEARLWWWG